MSTPAPSFVDRHGRTWPGPSKLGDREVSDVDIPRKLVIVRTGFCTFESVNPDDVGQGTFPDGKPPKRRKPRGS